MTYMHLHRLVALSVAAWLCGCASDDAAPDDVGATGDELGNATPTSATASWAKGAGAGTALRRVGSGADIAVFYGGYGATLSASEQWADAVYDADLASRNVGLLYAVKGPAQSGYSGREIGNSKIAADLVGATGAAATRIIVIAHSSGAFVAHEMLEQLADGRDGDDNAKGKVAYFNLDGASGPSRAARARLGGAWAVSVKDASGSGTSTNAGVASSNGATYKSENLGGHHVLTAASGVCNRGANWCLHMVCANERPYNKGGLDVADDYTDFDGHPVQVEYLSVLPTE
jgi:hypothetical protein